MRREDLQHGSTACASEQAGATHAQPVVNGVRVLPGDAHANGAVDKGEVVEAAGGATGKTEARKTEVGGFWPGRALKRLLAHCAQPRTGNSFQQRRERAEKTLQQQHAGESVLQACGRAADQTWPNDELGSNADSNAGSDASWRGRSHTPKAHAPVQMPATATQRADAMKTQTYEMHSDTAKVNRSAVQAGDAFPSQGGSKGAAPAHASAHASGVAQGRWNEQQYVDASSRQDLDQNATCRSTLPGWTGSGRGDAGESVPSGSSDGTGASWQAGSPQKMVRGPGGQWRPVVATGGGAGRPRPRGPLTSLAAADTCTPAAGVCWTD